MATSTATAPPQPQNPSQTKRQQTIQRGPLIQANFRAATRALKVNSTRSILTMLGVIIGVAAVITAVTQARGTSESINQRFSDLGTNVITIQPGPPPQQASSGFKMVVRGGNGSSSTLTLTDVQALALLQYVTQVSPIIQTNARAVYKNQSDDFPISGVSASYQNIHSLQLAEGDWFTEQDEVMSAAKVVLGANVASRLFSQSKDDPIGQTIRIGSQTFQVVGVLTSSNGFYDESIYIPFKTVQTRLRNVTTVDTIEVMADDTNHLDLLKTEITDLLEQRHRILDGKDDFWLQSAQQLIQNRQATASSLAALLIGIAAVALTVGGIGIMNIMLVSVTERTREIGVRMAVGANRHDIRNQFLIEAMLLSVIGGVIGVFFGVFIGYEVVTSSQTPFILDPIAILIAVGVAGLIGVGFGLYPAMRASELDPIEALRTA